MTCHALCGAGVAKSQVSDESSNGNRKHHPSVVRHEKQPDHVSRAPHLLNLLEQRHLHDEKAVEDLHSIQRPLHYSLLLLRITYILP